MKKEIIYKLSELEHVASELASLFERCSVFTFTGPLGAGKTTLIKALLKHQGIDEIVVSPTFTYVVAYVNNNKQTFYHFDLYRIKTTEQFVDAGFSEYLYQPNSWALIEWPDVIAPLIKKNICNITIDYLGEDKRILKYKINLQ